MRRLEGRNAIVTGASRGLGRAIAIALGAEGASVAVVARTAEVWDPRLPGTVQETADAVMAAGGRAIAIVADITDEDDRARLVSDAKSQLGPIDVLVNNAALTVSGRPGGAGHLSKITKTEVRLDAPPSLLDVPLKALRRHFEVNVFAPYRLMQLLLPDMFAIGRGSIVNVSSRSAFNPGEGPYDMPGRPSLFAYGSSKSALHNLTQAVAVEGATRGVAANVVIPSRPIHTPGTDLLMPDEGDTTDWATPEEFAEAVIRLAAVQGAAPTGRILWHDDVLRAIPSN